MTTESISQPTTVAELLHTARKRIEQPEQWCRSAFARRADGTRTKSDDPDAASFCLMGALHCGITPDLYQVHDEALVAVGEVMGGTRFLASFNDDPRTTHADVLALFDDAIAKAEGGAK